MSFELQIRDVGADKGPIHEVFRESIIECSTNTLNDR